MKQEFVKCEDCGMRERMEWIMQDKHICNTITDKGYIPEKGQSLRIGKKRFIKFV